MNDENDPTALSPTVIKVIDRFTEAMRADQDIPADAIDRLEQLLRSGAALKPDEINAALFPPPPDGET